MAIRNYAQQSFRSDGDQQLVPRQRFNFTIILDIFDRAPVTFTRVSNVTVPGYTVDAQIMNQYNKKRVVQTKLNYEPVTVSFYDTFDSQFHDILRDYFAHYYNGTNGIDVRTLLDGTSTVTDNFETDFGYTPVTADNRYFFTQIRIMQNGYRDQYRETILKAPHITAAAGDTLDYSDSGATMWSITFQPESVQVQENGQGAGSTAASFVPDTSVSTSRRPPTRSTSLRDNTAITLGPSGLPT